MSKVPGLTLQTPDAFRAQHAPDIRPSKRGTIGDYKQTLQWDSDREEMFAAFMRALCAPSNLEAAGLKNVDAQDIAEGYRVAMAARSGREHIQFDDGSRGFRQSDDLLGRRLIDGHPENEPTDAEELKRWMRANAARWSRRWKKINAIQTATGFSLLVRWRGRREFKAENETTEKRVAYKTSVYLDALSELLIDGVSRARGFRGMYRVERFKRTAHEFLAALPRDYRPETPTLTKSQIAKQDTERARLDAGGEPTPKKIGRRKLDNLTDSLSQVCDALEKGELSLDELPDSLGAQLARFASLLPRDTNNKDTSSYTMGSRAQLEDEPESETTFPDSKLEFPNKNEDEGEFDYTSACSDEMVYQRHTCPSPDVSADEINERMSQICEARGIAFAIDEEGKADPGYEDDAEQRAEANKQARRDLCEVCQGGPL
jgi:hypothetical protein